MGANGSRITEEVIVQMYDREGYVTLLYWDKNVTVPPSDVTVDPSFTRNQRFALADCVWNHKNDSRWFGIWDVDEFLYLEGSKDVPDFISTFLEAKQVDDYHIPMQTFGPSGHLTTPKGLVVENYTWRRDLTIFGADKKTNKFSGKSMYRSGCAMPEVHWTPQLPDGCRTGNEWSAEAKGNPVGLPIYLRHYFSKSWQDYQEKWAKWGWVANTTEFQEYMAISSELQDLSMIEFVEPIKQMEQCMRQ